MCCLCGLKRGITKTPHCLGGEPERGTQKWREMKRSDLEKEMLHTCKSSKDHVDPQKGVAPTNYAAKTGSFHSVWQMCHSSQLQPRKLSQWKQAPTVYKKSLLGLRWFHDIGSVLSAVAALVWGLMNCSLYVYSENAAPQCSPLSHLVGVKMWSMGQRGELAGMQFGPKSKWVQRNVTTRIRAAVCIFVID